ncbi:MAG: efflux RND transporter periplasmic adaptor subunit [Verrucomicrobiales bacterium]|nr:efflux RND transporter periplasmic adaptor subunit [Verrucomicrobiales bacterium]
MEDSDQENQGNAASTGGGLRWVILALVLVGGLWLGIQALRNAEPAGAGGSQGGGASQGPPPATVIVAPVTQTPVQETRSVTGTLRAMERANVAAQESGAVLEVKVDVGDSVKKGDVIALLDERRLKASLLEAKANLTASEAAISERSAESERAKRDLEMKEKLFSQRAVAEREVLDARESTEVKEARLKASKDQVDAMQSALELLEVRLSDATIKAPFDGRIVSRHVDPGEWIAPGNPVVTLISTGKVEAWMSVPERFIGQITSSGNRLSIIADGSGESAEVISLRQVADIDPVTRLFPVVVTLNDKNGSLAPGLSVHADLPVGEESARLGVPVNAVIESYQGASVMKVVQTGDGLPVAERVPVTTLFRRNEIVYVESPDLKPGDQVVVEGNERLFPGTPLMVATPEKKSENAEEVKTEVKP